MLNIIHAVLINVVTKWPPMILDHYQSTGQGRRLLKVLWNIVLVLMNLYPSVSEEKAILFANSIYIGSLFVYGLRLFI